MKILSVFTLSIILFSSAASAQKIESIDFHLYTDSLKKGIHNYINVDAKLSDGSYRPLTDKQLNFSCNTGTWQGNDLIIDSSYNKDSVVVTASLKDDAAIKKTVTIYMKKNLNEGNLKSEEELMKEWNNNSKKRRRN